MHCECALMHKNDYFYSSGLVVPILLSRRILISEGQYGKYEKRNPQSLNFSVNADSVVFFLFCIGLV